MNDNLIYWGKFKINVGVSPFKQYWDRWSKWHLVGCYLLTLLFYYLKFPVLWCGLLTFGIAILWEVGDAYKPLWSDWVDKKPKWIGNRWWNYLGLIGSADGFGLHDLIVSGIGIIAALLCIGIYR